MKKQKPVRTPFQWIGGKYEIAPWICSRFPGHKTYVEGFGGAAGVLLHKEPSAVEVYNDLDKELVNFFRVARERPEDLARGLLLSPYARSEFEVAKALEGDDLERARKFAVVARQSMGGVWGRAWSAVVGHSRRGMGSSNSRWLNLPEDILAIAGRFARVQIESLPALDLIRRYDRKDTLFYLDPPYLPATRQEGLYRYEMAVDKHVELLALLARVQGKVVLSGYASDLYDEALRGWWREVRQVTCRSNVKASGQLSDRPKREEVLWMNFEQGSL